jgi:hypothetical protein
MQRRKQSLTFLLASALTLAAACGGDDRGPDGGGGGVERPTIIVQPFSTSAYAGRTAQFYVEASGPGPIGYRWLRNGVAVEGGTQQQLTTPILTEADSGARYRAVAENEGGAVESVEAVLTVNPLPLPPVVTTPPANRTVYVGESTTLEVVATGDGLRYQWSRDGLVLEGATAASYTTGPLARTDDGARYGVTIQNDGGLASAECTVTVAVRPPVIVQQPQDVTVPQGATATFHVVADGTPPFGYQWLRNGAAIPGANADTLTFSATGLGSGTTYVVIVANEGGSVRSTAARLTVTP